MSTIVVDKRTGVAKLSVMPTSKLNALHQINPEEARELILNAFVEAEGNARVASELIGYDYQIVLRLIKRDEDLANQIMINH